jgi:hypothetical protein
MASAATLEIYPVNTLSERKLRALIVEHNKGVRSDHAVCALLDSDLVVNTTTYEAGLTALEVAIVGEENEEDATVPVRDPAYLSEGLFRVLIEQINARIDDLETVVGKLNLDSGVTDTDYDFTATPVTGLGITGGGIEFTPTVGNGADADLLDRLVEAHNTLTEDWHALAKKLDEEELGESGDYENELIALTLTIG